MQARLVRSTRRGHWFEMWPQKVSMRSNNKTGILNLREYFQKVPAINLYKMLCKRIVFLKLHLVFHIIHHDFIITESQNTQKKANFEDS